MQLPAMTKVLACRIQNVLFSLQTSGMAAAQQYADNPYDIQLQHFGKATAYATRAIPGGGWWNRVVGFDAENIAQLDDILAFFRASH
ncbi:MAG: hypothetical protein ACRDHW_20875, partial [Ktedonobacteraceae bacterium]